MEIGFDFEPTLLKLYYELNPAQEDSVLPKKRSLPLEEDKSSCKLRKMSGEIDPPTQDQPMELDSEELWFITECILCKKNLTSSSEVNVSKLLQCLHSICNDCFMKWTDNEDKICPVCSMPSKKTEIRENKVLCEIVGENEHPDVDGKVCNIHDAPVTHWCSNCAEFICEDCVKSHGQLKSTRDHTIQTKEEHLNSLTVGEPKQVFPCAIHPQNQLTIVCHTCRAMTCRDCQLELHRDHKYDFVTDKIDEAKKDVHKFFQKIQYHSIVLSSAIDKISIREKKLDELKLKLISQIKDLFDVIIDLIRRRCKELMLAAVSKTNAKLAECVEGRGDLQKDLNSLNLCLSFVKTVLYKSSDPVIFYTKDIMLNHMERIRTKSRIPNAVDVINLRFIPTNYEELEKCINNIGCLDEVPDTSEIDKTSYWKNVFSTLMNTYSDQLGLTSGIKQPNQQQMWQTILQFYDQTTGLQGGLLQDESKKTLELQQQKLSQVKLQQIQLKEQKLLQQSLQQHLLQQQQHQQQLLQTHAQLQQQQQKQLQHLQQQTQHQQQQTQHQQQQTQQPQPQQPQPEQQKAQQQQEMIQIKQEMVQNPPVPQSPQSQMQQKQAQSVQQQQQLIHQHQQQQHHQQQAARQHLQQQQIAVQQQAAQQQAAAHLQQAAQQMWQQHYNRLEQMSPTHHQKSCASPVLPGSISPVSQRGGLPQAPSPHGPGRPANQQQVALSSCQQAARTQQAATVQQQVLQQQLLQQQQQQRVAANVLLQQQVQQQQALNGFHQQRAFQQPLDDEFARRQRGMPPPQSPVSNHMVRAANWAAQLRPGLNIQIQTQQQQQQQQQRVQHQSPPALQSSPRPTQLTQSVQIQRTVPNNTRVVGHGVGHPGVHAEAQRQRPNLTIHSPLTNETMFQSHQAVQALQQTNHPTPPPYPSFQIPLVGSSQVAIVEVKHPQASTNLRSLHLRPAQKMWHIPESVQLRPSGEPPPKTPPAGDNIKKVKLPSPQEVVTTNAGVSGTQARPSSRDQVKPSVLQAQLSSGANEKKQLPTSNFIPTPPPVICKKEALENLRYEDVLSSLNELNRSLDRVEIASDHTSAASVQATVTSRISTEDRGEVDSHEDWCAACMDGGHLVCCDVCPKAFHRECHIPVISNAESEGAWQCLLCRTIDPVVSGDLSKLSLTTSEKKAASRLLLEMYCQYDASLHLRSPISPQNTHYYELVKQPICLDQIRDKLANSRYKSVVEFVSDIKLMFNNYYLYHKNDTGVVSQMKSLEELFNSLLSRFLSDPIVPDLAAIKMEAMES